MPHLSMHWHLSLEPPEQPLTSAVKVDSLRPGPKKGKPPKPSLPPLPHCGYQYYFQLFFFSF